jgi:hypothetical protein
MPVESDDDRLALLEDWDTATIGGVSVPGIFHNAYESINTGDVDVAGARPAFQCRAMDVASITIGTTTALINSVTYTIINAEPDGAGLVVLVLRK